jgi:hypothetical protein
LTLVSSIKRRLHREIVADRVARLVLNLIINGEQYPSRDRLFSAGRRVRIAQRMRSHMRGEDKAVITSSRWRCWAAHVLPGCPTSKSSHPAHTPRASRREEDDDRDTRTLKLAHFLGHLHFLEEAHQPLAGVPRGSMRGVRVALQAARWARGRDESGHVIYTRETVEALLPAQKPAQVFAGTPPSAAPISISPPGSWAAWCARHGERFCARRLCTAVARGSER